MGEPGRVHAPHGDPSDDAGRQGDRARRQGRHVLRLGQPRPAARSPTPRCSTSAAGRMSTSRWAAADRTSASARTWAAPRSMRRCGRSSGGWTGFASPNRRRGSPPTSSRGSSAFRSSSQPVQESRADPRAASGQAAIDAISEVMGDSAYVARDDVGTGHAVTSVIARAERTAKLSALALAIGLVGSLALWFTEAGYRAEQLIGLVACVALVYFDRNAENGLAWVSFAVPAIVLDRRRRRVLGPDSRHRRAGRAHRVAHRAVRRRPRARSTARTASSTSRRVTSARSRPSSRSCCSPRTRPAARPTG